MAALVQPLAVTPSGMRQALRRSAPFAAAGRRRRQRLCCSAAGSARPPTIYDDLSSVGGVGSFDDLMREQLRAMERVQAEMSSISREMDQRFAAAQREAEAAAAASSSGRSVAVEGQQGGPCGYRWHSRTERMGPGGRYQEYRSESLTVIGVPPPHCGMMHAQPPAVYGGLSSLWLLLAAALAGFWAAATAAFNRRFGLTIYKQESKWRLLLLWPFLLLTSSEFRQQFWAAVRGQRAPPPPAAAAAGGDGEQFVA